MSNRAQSKGRGSACGWNGFVTPRSVVSIMHRLSGPFRDAFAAVANPGSQYGADAMFVLGPEHHGKVRWRFQSVTLLWQPRLGPTRQKYFSLCGCE
jgi:hypothetical protein